MYYIYVYNIPFIIMIYNSSSHHALVLTKKHRKSMGLSPWLYRALETFKGGTPIAGWFIRENPIKMDDN